MSGCFGTMVQQAGLANSWGGNLAPRARFLVLSFSLAPPKCLRFKELDKIGLIGPNLWAHGPFVTGVPPKTA